MQDNVCDAIESLHKILTPNENGSITFGQHKEPLRRSQIEALQAIQQHLESGQTPKFHLVMPGGTGKTRIGLTLSAAMYKKNRNTLFVVPNQQTLRDFVSKANALGVFGDDVGAVYEGEKRIGKLTFITYASLIRRLLGDEATQEIKELAEADHRDAMEHQEILPPKSLRIDPNTIDLLVWDEGHMYLTPLAQSLIKKFDHAINMALTATPRYYEGKDVADVFGKKILEIDLDTAKARGEICDFENFLIDTGIITGIELTSPEQEESAQVSAAINRPDRNLIFADLYKNSEIAVTRNNETKAYTLAGEPTLIFSAGIDHVHAMADDINLALTPALKTDLLFRQRLRDKNIDPDDPNLVIAAPIHTGATDNYEGMTLAEREAMIDRYHQRKVLILCSTSLLQQSFDSRMTSVVIDSVPRQTYVGVGQGGMRATRAGKEMAFIINCQDEDHSSLTFEDFRNCRGSEEGVAVEIAGHYERKPRKEHSPSVPEDRAVADYRLTCGSSLQQLAAKRRAQPDPLYLNTERDGYIRGQKYVAVKQMILEIASGQNETVPQLIQEIHPWIKRTAERIAKKTIDHPVRNKTKIDDAVLTVLGKCLDLTKAGNIATWTRFSMRFQADLRNQFEKIQKHDAPVREHAFSQFDPTLELERLVGDYQMDPAGDAELAEAVERMLKTLSYREREVIKLRTGYADGHVYTQKEVGEIFKCSSANIHIITKRAARKMQQPERQPPAIQEQNHELPPKHLLANKEAQIRHLKKTLKRLMADHEGWVDCERIAELAGVNVAHVRVLADSHSISYRQDDYERLRQALDPQITDRIMGTLPSMMNVEALQRFDHTLIGIRRALDADDRPDINYEEKYNNTRMALLKSVLRTQLDNRDPRALAFIAGVSRHAVADLLDDSVIWGTGYINALNRDVTNPLAYLAKNPWQFRTIISEMRELIHHPQRAMAPY